jgi:hypothetical protein
VSLEFSDRRNVDVEIVSGVGGKALGRDRSLINPALVNTFSKASRFSFFVLGGEASGGLVERPVDGRRALLSGLEVWDASRLLEDELLALGSSSGV